ncbi:FecR family protein [Sunxiuqinia rutila]|uniref:FecR family protein n=1 Tax=Sunxiuqinia rutila TaxID=1397841 RepID=UPI003D35A56B
MKDIALIVANYLLKNASKDEIESLAEWKNRSNRNLTFVKLMEEYWNYVGEEETNSRIDIARQRLLTRIDATSQYEAQRLKPVSYLIKIAATIILIVSIAGLSVYIASETGFFTQKNWVVVSTEAGQQSKVTLPDGTTVWLNADTEVKYSTTKDERMVKLSGEAYFEVEHAPDLPFVVDMRNVSIRVLGTKFSASHYPDSKMTEATLLTGKISMTIQEISQDIELQSGQKVAYDSNKTGFIKTSVRAKDHVLWRYGILVFDNESFNDLIQKLERYYAVDFIYEESDFEDIHYTGKLDNLSIEKVLEFINLTIPVAYEIDNKTIKLNSK